MENLVTCPRCDGSGEVHWNRSRHRDPQWDESADCSYCNGYGAVSKDRADVGRDDDA